MKASYDECLKRVLQHEGGYSNDPGDPGGPTNWGITIEDARMYWRANATASDVRAMPLSVAKDIYKSKYWDKQRCDDLPAGVDDTVFDYGVNSGVGRSARILQEAVGVRPDGVIGEQTVAAALAADPVKTIQYINDERLRFLKGLKTWRLFGVGWGRRVAEVKSFSLQLAAAAKKGHPTPPAPTVLPVPNKSTSTLAEEQDKARRNDPPIPMPVPAAPSWWSKLKGLFK